MNNTEKNIKEKYNAMLDAAAPDMDALWSRIDAALPEKSGEEVPAEPITLTPAKKPVNYRRITAYFAAAAACIAMAVVLPKLAEIDRAGSSYVDEAAQAEATEPAETTTQPYIDAAENIPNAEEASEGIGSFPQSAAERFGSSVSYDKLALTDGTLTEVTPYAASQSGAEYFVEDEVLSDTELFCKAIVKDVYYSKEDGTVFYTIEPSDEFTRNGGAALGGDEITVSAEVVNGGYFSDKAEYLLMENREYLLPVCTDENGEYKLVYPFAPQIEITLDNYYIFHNGWNTLMSDGVCDVVCSPQGKDDFYYDRMKLCSAEEVEKLIRYWQQS